MLGDFNMTEDPIDRLPLRLDDPNAIAALKDVRLEWKLTNQWRAMYLDAKEFTYHVNTPTGQIKSRLDRIYIMRNLTPLVFNWKATPSLVLTDHWLIITKYAPKDAPEIEKGR